MIAGHRKFALAVLLIGVAVSAQLAAGERKQKTTIPQMDEQKRAVHALNRLAFGPRPGDVDRVLAIGVDKWIEQQLHPDKIDNSALDARLAPLRTLRMDTQQLVDNFPSPQVIKAVAEGMRSLPSDPTTKAIYLARLDRYEEKLKSKQETEGAADSGIKSAGVEKVSDSGEELAPTSDQIRELLAMPPDERYKQMLSMSTEERRVVTNSLKGKREQALEGMSPQQRETLIALNNPQQVVNDELVEGKVLSATYSERQLQEVMTDFWFNHFNVFVGKGADHYFLTSYERDVIRPHAMGKFEDLLRATAESPAMLFYLDNWLSVGPNSDAANGIHAKDWKRRAKANGPVNQAKGKRGGLNENYGRELMELHTLGVNGGYTQKVVTEVARVFTGWTLKQPGQGGAFKFDERMHEPGDKIVLGHRIKPNGQKEGFEVLHLLAHDPSTAKFISTKLAMRFVSDDPPSSLVGRMALTFLSKDGDIREVLRTLFNSPEFWAADAYRAKLKTPLEFTVSALRASGAEVGDALPIVRQLQNMGMPLYGMQPPTGYSMKAETWVNSSALLARMNFALALASGKLKGTRFDSDLSGGGRASSAGVAGDPQEILATLENSLLAGDVSRQTHDTIAARLDDSRISQRKLDDPARAPNIGLIEGLLLGSPDFQRR